MWKSYLKIFVVITIAFNCGLLSNLAHGGSLWHNHELRIIELEKTVSELREIINQAPTPRLYIPACDSSSGTVDLRSAPVGFKCRTSNYAIFEKVNDKKFGEAWIGPDALIWGQSLPGNVSQYRASDICASKGGALPTIEDFKRGEANGFREVFPNMPGHKFWSSSGGSMSSLYGLLFNGSNGSIEERNRTYSVSVRCVWRQESTR
jgi:hypothetical protein